MSKAATFNAAKYRSNPKAIANYLNDALATDDSAFVRALGNLARAHGMGPSPKRRT
jgi:DNA-binding phage protein